jgi:hypothetical protein
LVGAVLGCGLLIGGAAPILPSNAIDPEACRLIFLFFGAGNLLAMIRSTATTIHSAAGNFAYVNMSNGVLSVIVTCASGAAVLCGAGPVVLAAIYCIVIGAGGLVHGAWDIRRCYVPRRSGSRFRYSSSAPTGNQAATSPPSC